MGSVWKRRPPSFKTSVSTAVECHTIHLLRVPQGFPAKRGGSGGECSISKMVNNSKGCFCKVLGATRAFCF